PLPPPHTTRRRLTWSPPLPLPHRHTPLFFFFNDPAPTEIYTLSLHDALPIFSCVRPQIARFAPSAAKLRATPRLMRSEEHTSELQSLTNLVCRLLLEKNR